MRISVRPIMATLTIASPELSARLLGPVAGIDAVGRETADAHAKPAGTGAGIKHRAQRPLPVLRGREQDVGIGRLADHRLPGTIVRLLDQTTEAVLCAGTRTEL